MSKLVDKERLAQLAKALDQRAKAAVAAEAARAKGEEARIEGLANANTQAIAAINDVENGILKQAKDYADGLDAEVQRQLENKVEQSVYEAKVKLLDEKDAGFNEDILEMQAAIQTLQTQMGEGNFAALDKAIKDATQELVAKDTELEGKANAAQEAADKAQEEVDALEVVVGNKAAEGVEATGLFADVKKVADDLALEVQRAAAAEVQNANDIDVLEQKDVAHEGRLDALEAKFNGDNSVDAKIQKVAQDLADFEGEQAQNNADQLAAINAKVAQADYDAKVLVLEQADSGLAARLEIIEGQGEGSIKKAVADEAGIRLEADNALEARIVANENKLAGLEKDTVQQAIDQAEADAKAHAEQKIADLVDSAPEAMNTLKELAEAIKDNKDIYEAYIAEHASACDAAHKAANDYTDQQLAAKHAVISAEIDADVKVEADRAKAEEALIRQEFVAADTKLKTDLQAEIDQDVAVEAALRVAEEAKIRQELANEKAALQKEIDDDVKAEENRALAQEAKIREEFAAADEAVVERVAAVEAILGNEGEAGGFADVVTRLAQAEKDIDDLVAEDQELAGEIAKKVDQEAYNTKVQELANADAALDNRIKVFEAGGAQDVAAKEVRLAAAEQDIDDLEAFVAGHSHTVMEQNIANNAKAIADEIQDRKDAVAKEVTDRNAAIAKALEDYSTSEEVLELLGNVVNSLALAIEDNQMVLKLGGVDGVALNSVELDIATEDDIQAIIDGLDE